MSLFPQLDSVLQTYAFAVPVRWKGLPVLIAPELPSRWRSLRSEHFSSSSLSAAELPSVLQLAGDLAGYSLQQL
eukprot:9823079-Heterocapsa_arctica.AAC.1